MVSGQLRSLVNESPPRPADETRDSSFLGGSGIRAGAESLLTSCPGWASESDDSLDSVAQLDSLLIVSSPQFPTTIVTIVTIPII